MADPNKFEREAPMPDGCSVGKHMLDTNNGTITVQDGNTILVMPCLACGKTIAVGVPSDVLGLERFIGKSQPIVAQQPVEAVQTPQPYQQPVYDPMDAELARILSRHSR